MPRDISLSLAGRSRGSAESYWRWASRWSRCRPSCERIPSAARASPMSASSSSVRANAPTTLRKDSTRRNDRLFRLAEELGHSRLQLLIPPRRHDIRIVPNPDVRLHLIVLAELSIGHSPSTHRNSENQGRIDLVLPPDEGAGAGDWHADSLSDVLELVSQRKEVGIGIIAFTDQ